MTEHTLDCPGTGGGGGGGGQEEHGKHVLIAANHKDAERM